MKRFILSLAVVFFSLVAGAQNAEYYKVMGETLGKFANCKTAADFQDLGNKFGMIANAEKSEWLPVYYQAHCYILMSFIDQDAAKKDSYLDEAEKLVNKLVEMAPNEAEVYVLQSFFYTGRLVVNPAERGQQFSQLSGQAIGKALALEPNNPRARMLKIQMDMGAARFFGNDPNSYCPDAKKLLASWDQYKPKSPLYPNWGKEQVEEIVKGCE